LKKLLLTTLCIIFTFTLFSCSKPPLYEGKISQLRQEIFFAENEQFKLVCYPETRENPMENDGVCGNTENVIIFRLTFKTSALKDSVYDINFDINGKGYNGKFEYKTIPNLLTSTVCVETLNFKDLQLTVNSENQTYSLKATAQKNSDTIAYEKAINQLSKNDESVKEFLNSNNYELKIRLIDNEGYDYWYIGFSNADKSVSFLVDGKTGETVAKKEGV